MNTQFSTIRMVLIFSFFFTQHIYSMKRLCLWIYGKPVQDKQFIHFSRLPKDVQFLVLEYAVRDSDNKVNLQVVNKEWSEVVSIKHPKIFDTCCNIEHSHMKRIFLHAVYNNNYDGVENILKNSYLNRIKDKNLCYRHIDTNESGHELVLDPYHIAQEDEQMIGLLKKYNVATLLSDVNKAPCQTTALIMACLVGDSDAINYDKNNKADISRALNIVVTGDYGKCMQRFIDGSFDESLEDLFRHDEFLYLLGRKLLRRACIYKSYKVLKILLHDRYCDKNNSYNGDTLLDEMLRVAEDDSTFEPVVVLLKEYGAKTLQQINDENAAKFEEDWGSQFPFY
jgi:hypothetical protein